MSGESSRGVRVVKVGGSLFDWPELPRALRTFLDGEPRATNVLLAGGGDLAEAIRQADAALGIGEEAAHWLCIEALGITAQLLAGPMRLPLVRTFADLQNVIAGENTGSVVFDPRDFLLHDESALPGEVLPHNWDVTSDSIAARLAEVLPSEELVLLKSADPPEFEKLEELAALGYVDRHFPRATGRRGICVFLANLRGAFEDLGSSGRIRH
jgi:aspartokinase-like uncharacterized kinase